MFTFLLAIGCIVALFTPGLAVLQRFAPDWKPETRFILAPLVMIPILALGGLVGWVLPTHFTAVSCLFVALPTIGSLAYLVTPAGRVALTRLDPVLPAGYVATVLFATQFVLLPVRVPRELFPERPFTYIVQEDVLPVRIQAIFHNLPCDNLIPFRFADFMLRGVDFRVAREFGCGDKPAIAPGQYVNARTPLMSLVGVHAVALAGPALPVDGKPTILAEYRNDDAYLPFFVAATTLNALLILPAYLLGMHFSGRRAARLALLLLAVNAGVLIQGAFIWPKALGGYFAGLLLWHFMTPAPRAAVVGPLSALAYYSHPCAAGMTIGCLLYHLVSAGDRSQAMRGLVTAGALAFALVLPWFLWGKLWLRTSGNLISQNMQDQSLSEGIHVRATNMLRTMWPYPLLDKNRPFSDRLHRSSFVTLPGMLGLTLLPFLFLGMRRWQLTLPVLCVLFSSLLLTAFPFGKLHGGMMPFGVFLCVPVLVAVACVPLAGARWSRWLVLLCAIEQMAVVWMIYSPQRESPGTTGQPSLIRMSGLVLLQLLLLGLSAVSLRSVPQVQTVNIAPAYSRAA